MSAQSEGPTPPYHPMLASGRGAAGAPRCDGPRAGTHSAPSFRYRAGKRGQDCPHRCLPSDHLGRNWWPMGDPGTAAPRGRNRLDRHRDRAPDRGLRRLQRTWLCSRSRQAVRSGSVVRDGAAGAARPEIGEFANAANTGNSAAILGKSVRLVLAAHAILPAEWRSLAPMCGRMLRHLDRARRYSCRARSVRRTFRAHHRETRIPPTSLGRHSAAS